VIPVVVGAQGECGLVDGMVHHTAVITSHNLLYWLLASCQGDAR
jgi:hypothetical protein